MTFTRVGTLTAGSDSTNTLTGEPSAVFDLDLSGSANNGTYSDSIGTVHFNGFDYLTGSTDASNKLVGDNNASTWTMTGPNTGTYSNTGSTLTFSGFDTLQGSDTSGGNVFDINAAFSGSLLGGGYTSSTGPDVFNLNTAGSVSGSITGKSGNSTINYSANVNVTVNSFSSPGYSGYSELTITLTALAASTRSTSSGSKQHADR